ncbi:DUF3558 domain-containing protein [Nocardia sp. NPDC050697]|uniref:DUF3558 domain-containing protein n=1 Tax=Nocardia sp. NPDC050697 TaxID=3155158 RepID=UPI0033DA07C2
MRGRFALACVLAVVPLMAGCESGTEGSATPSSVAPEALFDSCSLPDEAIRAAGADPAQKNDNPFGVPRSGWRGCRWGADGYALRIFATTKSVDEFRANSQFHDFRSADLPGREATLFIQGAPSEPKNCNVFYGTSRGTIQLYVVDDQLKSNIPEPCGLVTRAAQAVDQWVPR